MAELDELIAEWTATRRRPTSCSRRCTRGGVPAGRIFRPQDMLADPHFAAREAIVTRAAPRASASLPMQNVVPQAVGHARRGAVGRAGARRAQRRDLPRPARPGRRRAGVACTRDRRHLSERRRDDLPTRRRRRRHVHRRAAGRRGHRHDLAGQDRLDARSDQSVGVLTGIDKVCAAAGIAADVGARAARHDGRDQRDPRGQGRHGRPGDHRRLPAGAADRPVVRARRPGRLDHLAQARAARRAGEHRRGRSSGSAPTATVVHRARRGRHPRGAARAARTTASRRSPSR